MRRCRSRAPFAGASGLCILMLGCALAVVPAASADGGAAPSSTAAAAALAIPAAQAGSGVNPSATLEQCLTAPVQNERSATFSGEMTETSSSGRMSMRIELQERLSGEAAFHTVAAPGLGVWRAATPGVKVYRYIKQVTNLSAPAVYRAAIRFRWLNARGKLVKVTERRTSACVEPALHAAPAAPASTTPAGG